MVHGSSDCGVEGGAPRHARRSAALLGVGDHHGGDELDQIDQAFAAITAGAIAEVFNGSN